MKELSTTPILDACCGGKMFYFDKHDERVLFKTFEKWRQLCVTDESLR